MTIDSLKAALPSADVVAGAMYGIQWRAGIARCPQKHRHAHGDRNPSLRFDQAKNRIFCASQGCFGDKGADAVDFVRIMDGIETPAAVQKLADHYGIRNGSGTDNRNGHGTPRSESKPVKTAESVRRTLTVDGWRIVAEFAFSPDVRKVRLEHATKKQENKGGKPEKTFIWEHLGADGIWYSGAGGKDKPAYVNQVFRDRDQVSLALGFEGEAKADAVAGLGMAAFSFKEMSEESAAALADVDVVLWPDNDVAGAKSASSAIAKLQPHARSIRLINPPAELPAAGDVIDALAMGWDSDRISRLISDAERIPATATENQPPQVLSVADILSLDIPEASMLIEGIVPATGASLIVGAAKSGKTLDAVQKCIAVASGTPLYGRYRVLAPGPVLIVEQDDPAGAGSIKTILQRSSVPVSGIPFHLVAGVPFEFGPEFLEWLEGQLVRLSIRLAVLDSYTALRGSRSKGVDIVKAEQGDLTQLDALAKRTNCALLIIHHSSKGSAGLDWSEKAAGTFAMSAATESQTFISRFSELDGAAPERLVRIRGRHSEDLEMVLRFRKETLDYEHVMEGAAATLYPAVLQIQSSFGAQGFSPKELTHATGLSLATVHRQISRLYRAGVLNKRGYGEYVLVWS